MHRFTQANGGWTVTTPEGTIQLHGRHARPSPVTPTQPPAPPPRCLQVVPHAPTEAPTFRLDTPDAYRRADEPYRGAERFSAEGWIWWLGDRLHVVLEVRKPTVVF